MSAPTIRVGQRWRTRDGYEAIILGIMGPEFTSQHKVRVSIPQFDDTCEVTLEGKGRDSRDDLVELISEPVVQAK